MILAKEPELTATLDTVVARDCFTAAELPEPTEEERRRPEASVPAADLGSLFEEADDA